MPHVHIYQIFYDQKSQQSLDQVFIPLSNLSNERPDWFEFWVIRNFLKSNEMDEESLYGFLSPSFREKTGIQGQDLLAYLSQVPPELEVVLFSHSWDQIAFFKNAFEQGEYFHPGLLDVSEKFFAAIGLDLDLKALIGTSMNSVFSNYLVAKPRFWRNWLEFAEKLWDCCEYRSGELTDKLNSSGRYQSGGHQAALKVFLQERIACVLLGTDQFNAMSLDLSHMHPVNDRLFTNDFRTRKLLNACDTMKLEFVHANDEDFRRCYWKCRNAIIFNDYFFRLDSLWKEAP